MQGVQLNRLISLTRTALSGEDRVRVMTQITVDAHNRDLVDTLIQANVRAPTAFQWQVRVLVTCFAPCCSFCWPLRPVCWNNIEFLFPSLVTPFGDTCHWKRLCIPMLSVH